LRRIERAFRFVDPDPVADRDKATHRLLASATRRLDSWGACPALGSDPQIVNNETVEGRRAEARRPVTSRGGHGLVARRGRLIQAIPSRARLSTCLHDHNDESGSNSVATTATSAIITQADASDNAEGPG